MGKSAKLTVSELARNAEVGVDDAIIALWDVGYSSISSPADIISGSDLKVAFRALNVPTAMELRSSAYWQKRLNINDEELRGLVTRLGFKMSAQARRLPQGSVKNLLKLAKLKKAPIVELPKEPQAVQQDIVPFKWYIVGNERNLRFLTITEVEAVHNALVKDFQDQNDPIYPAGIKSPDLFASAVFRPQTSLGLQLKYPTVEMAGAALLHSLVHNHPFHNGNKRTALVTLLVFLDENHYLLTCNEDDLFTLVLQVARHRLVDHTLPNLPDREVLAISEWVHKNARPVKQGERAIPFHKVRRILQDHGCRVNGFGSSGCKVNIERTIPAKKGLIFTTPARILKTQIYYGGEGREVAKNTINKLRTDLELDEAHGVDSGAFYDESPWSASDFIVVYRKTLDRLAVL